jgi:MFS family permease
MGGVFPVTVGILVDLFPSHQRGKLSSLIDATYFAGVVALGWAVAAVTDMDWQLLFWPIGAVFCALAASVGLITLPRHATDRPDRPASALALFAKPLRRKTIGLLAMISVNASSHQAFVGWITVYLVEIERVSIEAVAATLSAQALGSIIGCFAWGWTVDRHGRRAGGRGLMAAGLFALLFVILPGPVLTKQAAAFGFGFAFASVATIGPWLAELYPSELRAPATAIFQWGRCVSLFAPPVTGLVALHIGLPGVMALAGGGFLLAGLIWRSLPETHVRRSAE